MFGRGRGREAFVLSNLRGARWVMSLVGVAGRGFYAISCVRIKFGLREILVEAVNAEVWTSAGLAEEWALGTSGGSNFFVESYIPPSAPDAGPVDRSNVSAVRNAVIRHNRRTRAKAASI